MRSLKLHRGTQRSTEVYLVDDCLPWMQEQDDDSFDMTITSPPYEDARLYGPLGFRLKGQAWVDWAFERFVESYRITSGLTVWIVEGRTRKFSWSGTPVLLMAELLRAGIELRKPPIFKRFGIPGSGGPDFWRNDYEFCICASKGKLPWSDNTANGKPPKYGPGGEFSHRMQDGSRINCPNRYAKDGDVKRSSYKVQTRRKPDGSRPRDGIYKPPKLANAGNVIDCGAVGGGHLGHPLAHENEAPFPEKLIEPFVQCFCPPGGVLLDPFAGSGTSLAVAIRLGRRSVGLETRQDQIDLMYRRLTSSAKASTYVN